ncbi:hypothetical protein PRNP1_000484 [Phytophthora ramorum]
MSELSKPPQKKINWLKRLNLALDDDDSSDATPQPTDPERTHKKQQKKTPVKARRDDEDGGVAVDNSIRKRKDGSGHVKDNGEEPEARRRPQKQNKSEERRKRSHHGSGSENRLEKSRTSTTVGGMDEDGGHQTKPKEQAGKMTHRKRYHAEMATNDKTDQSAVDLKPEVSVDPAKAKAAASRQRRMRKLQARRKATGEHDRLTAIKLKRRDLLKASRIQRNQRRNTGKAIAAANKNCDVKDEVLAGPRHSSSEEAKERKRMLERQRRAALKAKKELAAQSNVLSLSKHSLSADRPPNWQKRQEELRRALGTKPRVLSEEGEPSQKRHKMQLERKDASAKVIKEPALETASKISPVKSPLSNNSEARLTDKSKVGQVKIVEFQQIAKQNGEGEKGGVHTPIPPKRVTNGGVKPELDSVNTCSNQTEGADLSGGQEEPERKQDHVVKTEIQEEGQVSSPALVSGVSGETTEPQSGNEKKASDEKEGMLLDMMPIPRKAFKRGPPAENAASFVIPKRSTNGQADDHPASRATNPPEAPIPVLTKLLPSPKSSPHYSIRDPIRSQRKRKKNPVPVKKSMLSAEDRALMRLGRKRNSIFMAVSELAFQSSPCEGSKKMSTTRMMGYEVLGIDGIALPDLIPRLSCATRREMASAKNSFDSSFFGVSLSIPKAKEDNCSTVDECAGGVHKMSCYEKLEFERPEDRDFYQRRMYGTTFTPQRLRGRTTLIKSKEKTAPDANDHLSGSTESDKGDSQTMSTSVLTKDDKNADSNAKKPAALTTGSPHCQSATIKDDTTHEQNIGSDEEGQEEGEIENTAVDLPQLAAHGYDRKMRQSPPRHWQQPNDMQIRQRQGDFRDDPRSYSREPSWYYRPYEDHSHGPDRRRSRSRSRPRPELSAPWNEGGRDGGWDDPHSKERRRSREFGPVDSMYSGNMDRYGERDYQDYRSGGDYSGRRGDAYSRQY